MALNRLLQKQVNKNLTAEQLADPGIRQLLEAVNASYQAFERDNDLLNHAFSVSEKEYQSVNKDLRAAYELKQISIQKLKTAIYEIDNNSDISFKSDEDELLAIVNYLNTEIIKRRQTENNLSRMLNLLTTLLSKLNSGILVEDENRKILFTNQLFCNIFLIPASPEQMVGVDCSGSAEQSKHLFKDPAAFISRIAAILEARVPVFASELEMLDGRILELDYIPIFVDSIYKGHLWDYTDITERKAHENRLLDLTNIQNAILNGTAYSIIHTDLNGVVRTFNSGAEKMLGYSASEIVNRRSPAMFHDPSEIAHRAIALSTELGYDVAPGFEVFIAKLKTQTVDSNEWTYIKKNGTRLTVVLSASAIKNASGEVMGYLGIARDVSDQKQAQAALALSEERYRSIVEQSTDIIYKHSATGFFTYVNPVAERVTGYSQHELLKMRFSELVKKEYRKATIEFYAKQVLQKKRTTYYEFPIMTKDGQEVWIGQSVQRLELDNEAVEFTALAINITERKIYERSIFLQNEKYRNIITNMNLGILEVDVDERVQFVNQSFTALSGYNIDEIIGHKASELFVLASHTKMVKEKTQQRSKGISDMYEIEVLNKAGEKRWWMVSGAPNYNDKGELIGSIGIHLDITEKKQLELALEAALLRAEESSKAKAVFLANMSHEIRTPLNGIIGMIRELGYENLPDKQMKFVSNASVASQHLLSVLNNILDISKIEAGELSLEKHHFSLRDTVKAVKLMMTAPVRAKKLLLHLDIRDIKNVTYIGDSSRIRQLLINLVGNAIKFTSSGGVFVECKIKETINRVHTVSIIVEDTGIGMEAAYLDHLFRKFSQEDASTSRKYGGTGLGMAITQEIIHLMGGTIQVSSKKNVGTVIELLFDLPLGDDTKIIDDNSALIISDLSQVKVLLVEDNEFNRAVAFNTLNRFKCQVTQAENGQQALDQLKKQNFDIILMDLQMPVMDGFETTKIIREKLGLQVPIIALTANAFKSELEQCLNRGMTDYVTKPFEEEKLMGMIIKTLQLKPIPLKTKPAPSLDIDSPQLYNLSKLSVILGNDATQIKKMIAIFTQQTTLGIEQIKTAYATKDLEALYQVVHRIKPGLDSMDVNLLHLPVREMEQSARLGKDSRALAAQVEFLVTTLGEIVEQLKLEEYASLGKAGD